MLLGTVQALPVPSSYTKTQIEELLDYRAIQKKFNQPRLVPKGIYIYIPLQGHHIIAQLFTSCNGLHVVYICMLCVCLRVMWAFQARR